MAIEFSPVVAAHEKRIGDAFSARSVDLGALGDATSPVLVLDHFRIDAPVFGPHPHAGFSAVSYVLEDSPGALRSRDTLGNDIVMGPGGIVWSQAGKGMMHEEVPAKTGRELRGFQIFVNVRSRNKFVVPRVLSLDAGEVPEWRSGGGDRVRVAVGSFEGVASPLVPVEPFTLLDAEVRREIPLSLPPSHPALVYVLSGLARVRAGRADTDLGPGQALGISGTGGRAMLECVRTAHVLVLSGAEIREPVVANGPFIMNDPSQIDAAFARYRAGEMGRLAPLSGS